MIIMAIEGKVNDYLQANSYLGEFAADGKQIIEGFRTFGDVAQEGGGVIDGHAATSAD